MRRAAARPPRPSSNRSTRLTEPAAPRAAGSLSFHPARETPAMKRLLGLSAALLLTLTALCGCGGGADRKGDAEDRDRPKRTAENQQPPRADEPAAHMVRRGRE